MGAAAGRCPSTRTRAPGRAGGAVNRTVFRGPRPADPFELWDRPVALAPVPVPRQRRRRAATGTRTWGLDPRNRRMLVDGALVLVTVLLLTASVLGAIEVTALVR